MKNSSRAFTLIELLVVISIIGMLSSVILASLSAARDKAKLGAGQQFNSNLYQAFGADAFGIWTFDDTDARDYSGKGNGGTLLNSATINNQDTFSNRGKSLVLDGNSAHVNITNSASVNMTSGTISVWIKNVYEADSNYRGILVKDQSFGLFLHGGFLESYNWVAPSGPVTSNVKLVDGKWHHVALSFMAGANASAFYIDGKLINRVSFNGIASTAAPILIGAQNTGSDTYFRGIIDDVALYTSVLALEDIHRIYAEGLPRHLAVE